MGDRRDSTSFDAEDGIVKAKFDLSQGTGIPIGQLPAMRVVGSRGAARKQQEVQLEPLHRLVYGRAGKAGERRHALEAFCGFLPEMQEDIKERLRRLKKDKLRDLIQALGMPVHISKPHAQVADDVAMFLMQPRAVDSKRSSAVSGQTSNTRAKKRQRASSPSNESDVEHAPKKVAKKTTDGEKKTEEVKQAQEVPVTGGMTVSSPAIQPSDDALRVAVYKWLIAVPREERAKLTTRVVRLGLERSFGELDRRKKVIKEAVFECMAGLAKVEGAAAAAAMNNAGSSDVTGMLEPSPTPQRPESSEPAPLPSSSTATTARSHAPPPLENTDGPITSPLVVPTCASDSAAVTLTTVSAVSLPPHSASNAAVI